MSMIERGKIRERATACATYHIAKRGEQSKAMCSEDGRAPKRSDVDRKVRGERAAVPPQIPVISKVRYGLYFLICD